MATRAGRRAPVSYGADARRGFSLQLPSGQAIGVALYGAGAVVAMGALQRLVYAGAAPGGGNIVMQPLARGTKDFISYANHAAGQQARYQITLPAGYHASYHEQHGVNFYAPGTERPVAYMLQPQVWDVHGRTHQTQVTVEGCTGRGDLCVIEANWDVPEAGYPVVLDPMWTTVTGMEQRIAFMTATELPNRRVLICGGFGAFENKVQPGLTVVPSNTCDVFQAPADVNGPPGEFVGSPLVMNRPRAGHTATTLRNGLVLIAGGHDEASAQQLYNPTTGMFSDTAIWPEPRIYHSASLLPDGRVLFAGGALGKLILGNAWMYDPKGDTWTQLPSMKVPRQNHTAAVLANGKVIAIGGVSNQEPWKNEDTTESLCYDSTQCDPSSGWSDEAILNNARSLHSQFVKDGRVFVVGGITAGALSNAVATPSIESLNLSGTRTWTTQTAALAEPRYGHTSTLVGGGVVVVGGLDPTTPGFDSLSTATLFAIQAGQANALVEPPTIFDEQLNFPRAAHAAVMVKQLGRLLIAGGYNNTGTTGSSHEGSSSVEILSLDKAGPGSPCFGDDECVSESCVGGACCDMAQLPVTDAACSKCDGAGIPVAVPDGVALSDGCLDSGKACMSNGRCVAGKCEDYAAVPAEGTETQCAPKSCVSLAECESGHCADDVCCDDECADPCRSCDQEGYSGQCLQVPVGDPCGEGLACDEQGACIPQVEPGDPCEFDGECRESVCLEGNCCKPPGDDLDCGDYRCGADGACLNSCFDPAQCIDGNTCNAAGQCVPADVVTAADGCSVTSAKQPKRQWGALLSLFGVAVMLARRRREAAR